jgi:hypothetical protein
VNRQQRRAARRRASNEGIPIKFGTVGYGPDAPVDAPTHVWMCDCKSCRSWRRKIECMDHSTLKRRREPIAKR